MMAMPTMHVCSSDEDGDDDADNDDCDDQPHGWPIGKNPRTPVTFGDSTRKLFSYRDFIDIKYVQYIKSLCGPPTAKKREVFCLEN